MVGCRLRQLDVACGSVETKQFFRLSVPFLKVGPHHRCPFGDRNFFRHPHFLDRASASELGITGRAKISHPLGFPAWAHQVTRSLINQDIHGNGLEFSGFPSSDGEHPQSLWANSKHSHQKTHERVDYLRKQWGRRIIMGHQTTFD